MAEIVEFLETVPHQHHPPILQLDHDNGVDHDRHNALRVALERADRLAMPRRIASSSSQLAGTFTNTAPGSSCGRLLLLAFFSAFTMVSARICVPSSRHFASAQTSRPSAYLIR